MNEFPELYARLNEIGKTGLPQGYLGNIGTLGRVNSESPLYDGLIPETVVSLDRVIDFLEDKKVFKILNIGDPGDYLDALVQSLGELNKAQVDYARGQHSKRTDWDIRDVQGGDFDVHFLVNPILDSTYFWITYSNRFKKEVKGMEKQD